MSSFPPHSIQFKVVGPVDSPAPPHVTGDSVESPVCDLSLHVSSFSVSLQTSLWSTKCKYHD